MRASLIVLLALGVAPPVLAQPYDPQVQLQIDELRMQQQAAQQRAIDQSNQLMALEARLRAEQGIAEARVQASPPPLPRLPSASAVPPVPIDTSRLPSIPDAALADSNRRVQSATPARR